MKNLAIASLVLGLVALGVGLYCQLEVVPAERSLQKISLSLSYDDPEYRATNKLFLEKNDQKNLLGQIALVGSGLGLLVGIFAGIKKAKLGFIGALVSLPGLILGLLQATHMFS